MLHQKQVISQTILQQLGGGKRLQAMIGAYHFMVLEENGLSFKFKGSQKYNYCVITLTPLDTYTMTFQKWNYTTFEKKAEKSFYDVYWDNLIPIFESTTGLYLSLT